MNNNGVSDAVSILDSIKEIYIPKLLDAIVTLREQIVRENILQAKDARTVSRINQDLLTELGVSLDDLYEVYMNNAE